MEIKKLSASSYKTWKKCEWAYFLNYIAKLDGNPNWGAANGSVIHKVIELYLQDRVKNKNWRKLIPKVYAEIKPWIWHKTKSKETGKKVFTHPVEKTCSTCPLFKGGRCVAAQQKIEEVDGCPRIAYEETLELLEFVFENKHHYFDRKIIGIEDHYELDLGNGITINGYIDLVTEYDEETLEIIDYKSGDWTQSYDEVFQDIQARMYTLAVMQKYPQYKSYICTLEYFKGVPVTVAFDKEDIEETYKWIKETWSAIVQCTNPQRTCNQIWQCNSICIGRDNCDKIWEIWQNNATLDELKQFAIANAGLKTREKK